MNPRDARTTAWLLVFAALAVPSPATAQSTHYWRDQYGSRANLLGGLVIGSVRDASATYYNPGAMALSRQKSLVLATKVYQFTNLSIPDGAGEGRDLSSNQLQAAPDLIAGEFTVNWLGGTKLAYSLLNRAKEDLELKARRADPGSGTGPPPTDLTAGEALARHKVSEYWGGLSWSKRFGDRFAVGVTAYGAYRSERLRQEIAVSIAHPDSTLDQGLSISDVSYVDGRLLAKFGVAYEGDSFTLGANLTTAGLHVLGWGESYQQDASTGLDGFGPPFDQAYLSSDHQQDLDVRYKNPWSVGVGGSYVLGNWQLYFSAEWFSHVDRYLILAAPGHYPQTGGGFQEKKVYDEAASVVNWGLGLQTPLSRNLKGYASFAVDRSAAVHQDKDDLSLSQWDIYRGTLGVEVTFSSAAMTVGLGYGTGSKDIALLSDLGDTPRDGVFPDQTRVIYRRIRLLLGADFRF